MIPDKNLRLALLDEIQADYDWVEQHETGYRAARAEHEGEEGWPTWETPEAGDEYEAHTGLEEYLLSLPLPEEALAEIEDLTLDGDRSVYGWIFPDWWNFGDHFVIRSFEGIACCSSLQSLSFGAGLDEGCSLRPLASLPQLRRIAVSASDDYREIEALLELPQLTKLEVINLGSCTSTRGTWQRVIDAVASRA